MPDKPLGKRVPFTDDWVLVAGGDVDESCVSLRFFGEDLDPDVVSRALSRDPTESRAPRDPRFHPESLRFKLGMWCLSVPRSSDEPLEGQIHRLFDLLPKDPRVWSSLTTRFEADLFCGLWLKQWNRHLFLSAQILTEIAQRQLSIRQDIYFEEHVAT